MSDFDYQLAFSRNIGWFTTEEQLSLRQKCVAIAGMGGVGGVYLITLARLGVGRFKIADFDDYEIQNFNRQYGANLHTVHRNKLDVMKEYALQINPEIEIEEFREGVNENNVGAFLNNVDLYLDGIDIFAMNARILVFQTCEKLKIPAITVAPLGMSAALGVYLPGQMSFEEYFQMNGHHLKSQVIRLIAGLAPRLLHAKYLVDPSTINLEQKKGPSTINGCQLCAGICGTEAVKILLKRKGVIHFPETLQFDAYNHRLVKSWRPYGNRNPLQKLLIKIMESRTR